MSYITDLTVSLTFFSTHLQIQGMIKILIGKYNLKGLSWQLTTQYEFGNKILTTIDSVALINRALAYVPSCWKQNKFNCNISENINMTLVFHLHGYRADIRFAPSQWKTALLCNDVSLAGRKPRISAVVTYNEIQICWAVTSNYNLMKLPVILKYFLPKQLTQWGRVTHIYSHV